MKTNIISISEFNERSGKNWSHNNDCEFHGVIPGYVCGWNVEATKDGKIMIMKRFATLGLTNTGMT